MSCNKFNLACSKKKSTTTAANKSTSETQAVSKKLKKNEESEEDDSDWIEDDSEEESEYSSTEYDTVSESESAGESTAATLGEEEESVLNLLKNTNIYQMLKCIPSSTTPASKTRRSPSPKTADFVFDLDLKKLLEEEDDDEEEEENEKKIHEDDLVSVDTESGKGKKHTKHVKHGKNTKKQANTEVEVVTNEMRIQEWNKHIQEMEEELAEWQKQKKDQPSRRLLDKMIKEIEKELTDLKGKRDAYLLKIQTRHTKIYQQLKSNTTGKSEKKQFAELPIEKQKKYIKELREIKKLNYSPKSHRLTVIEMDITDGLKAIVLRKIDSFQNMCPDDNEYFKLEKWIQNFMIIPFGVYRTLNILYSPPTIQLAIQESEAQAPHQEDKNAKIAPFLNMAMQKLNEAVYGMEDAKIQLMQYLGQMIVNPTSLGQAILFHGPPGVGKTSLVKDGLSTILNRPFAFVALGGATDSSFLEGHGYAYEGSGWGKLVQILMDAKCMNPIIHFDELDKVSDSALGHDIIGVLTHLIDGTQNMAFHDKYFSEVAFDFSKCLFTFSCNDLKKVNPVLRDRLYQIQCKGYKQNEKIVIAEQYLLPKIQQTLRFAPEPICIPKSVMEYIMETYCKEEKDGGVRELKRCLETIYSKLNLTRLGFTHPTLLNTLPQYPLTLTRDQINQLIVKSDTSGQWSNMYV